MGVCRPVGPRPEPEQLADLLPMASLELTPEELDRLSAAFAG